VSVMI